MGRRLCHLVAGACLPDTLRCGAPMRKAMGTTSLVPPKAARSRRWLCSSGDGGGMPLQGAIDRFGGVNVKLIGSDVTDLKAFQARLKASLVAWRGAGRCAVWAHVPNEAAAAVPALLEE